MLTTPGPGSPDALVLGIDVGGTLIKAGLLDSAGNVQHLERRPTGASAGPAAVIETILSFAGEMVADRPVRAVGIGVPGIVDSVAGVARYAANVGWRDVPFARLVAERLGVPAVLGHDVRNGAIAEARQGVGAGQTSVYFVAIGTGIAGGLVRNGVVDEGATGQAGEIGHLVVRPGGPVCGCGNRGCLEAIASAARIAAAYTGVTGEAVTADVVADRVTAGDAVAQRIWTGAVEALADALVAQTVLADPGCIVIGGGLSLAGATLLEPLRAALRPRLTFRDPPPLLLGALGDQAGLVGAGLRAWDMVGAG